MNESHILAFELHTYILIMDHSNCQGLDRAHFLEIVTDTVKIAIAIKYQIIFWLAIDISTFDIGPF